MPEENVQRVLENLTPRHYHHPEAIKAAAVKARVVHKQQVSDICIAHAISRRTLYRWLQQWKRDGNLVAKRGTGRRKTLDDDDVEALQQFVIANPAATNLECSAFLKQRVTPPTISRYLKRMRYTRKLFHDEPLKACGEDFEDEVQKYLAKLHSIPTEQRVYMDESFAYTIEGPAMVSAFSRRPCFGGNVILG